MVRAILLLLTFLLIQSFFVFAQTNYDRGFKVGYKEGYCYNDFKCLPPLPPITPLPYIGETQDNYQAGYNRGFKMGLENKSTKSSNAGNNTSYRTPIQSEFINTYVAPDFNLLAKAMEMRQQQYEKRVELEKQLAVSKIERVRAQYNSFTNYPKTIPDGWYNVIASNDYDFCADSKVYVKDNQITEYVIDGWDDRVVNFSGPIKAGKGLVKVNMTNRSKDELYDIYFIEYLSNPNVKTNAPQVSGYITFWIDFKAKSPVKLYIEDTYVGDFKSYFANGSPKCNQEGTLSFRYKPGTYRYRAESKGTFKTRLWEDTFTIPVDGCEIYQLSISN
jgi:hypothetical protein